MAYMSQEQKKVFQPLIKSLCKEYGIRASLAVRHYSSIVLNIHSGCIDFIDSYNKTMKALNDRRGKEWCDNKGNIQVNCYHTKENFSGKAAEFLEKAVKILYTGNHNNSDIMTDYHDVGWYVNINVGEWDKPYKFEKK